MSDRLTIRIDVDTKIKLNQIAYRKGFTLSEAVRDLIHREVGSDPIVLQLEALKKLVTPIASVDLNQVLYHIARSSIAPVAAVQMNDRESGDRLNELVKTAAEKIVCKIAGNCDVQ